MNLVSLSLAPLQPGGDERRILGLYDRCAELITSGGGSREVRRRCRLTSGPPRDESARFQLLESTSLSKPLVSNINLRHYSEVGGGAASPWHEREGLRTDIIEQLVPLLGSSPPTTKIVDKSDYAIHACTRLCPDHQRGLLAFAHSRHLFLRIAQTTSALRTLA